MSLQEKKIQLLKEINERRKKEADGADGEEWEDVDEHEKEVFATTGYFDVPDDDAIISKDDQAILKKMEQKH